MLGFFKKYKKENENLNTLVMQQSQTVNRLQQQLNKALTYKEMWDQLNAGPVSRQRIKQIEKENLK